MNAENSTPEQVQLLADTGYTIDVRPAGNRAELDEVYRLVYESYRQREYLPEHPCKMRMTLFNALPEAVTFLGMYQGQVIATVSLIPDSPAGLPMEEIYADKIAELRASGRRMAEVTMLADRRLDIRRTLPLLLELMKLIFDYGRRVLQATDLCITINPRHDEFYRRYLLFEDLGTLRAYPSVQNHPAIARRLNLENVRAKCENHSLLMRVFFENPTPESVFAERYRLGAEDVEYYAERLPIVSEASARLIAEVRGFYPDLPWKKWMSAAG